MPTFIIEGRTERAEHGGHYPLTGWQHTSLTAGQLQIVRDRSHMPTRRRGLTVQRGVVAVGGCEPARSEDASIVSESRSK